MHVLMLAPIRATLICVHFQLLLDLGISTAAACAGDAAGDLLLPTLAPDLGTAPGTESTKK